VYFNVERGCGSNVQRSISINNSDAKLFHTKLDFASLESLFGFAALSSAHGYSCPELFQLRAKLRQIIYRQRFSSCQ
jgi:hypothetical protein